MRPYNATPRAEWGQTFIGSLLNADMSYYPAVGKGTEIRFDDFETAGGALVDRDAVVHACAFAVRV